MTPGKHVHVTHVRVIVVKHVPVKVKTTVHTATHRPPKTDPTREQWDRAAKFAWHLTMVFSAIIMIMMTDRYMTAAMSAIMTDKVPEAIQELIDYVKKL